MTDTLELEANAAEEAARDAFAKFYSTVGAGEANVALPQEVAEALSRWVEARRALTERPPLPVRTGPRMRAKPPATITVPTPLTARDALALLFLPDAWAASEDGNALQAQTSRTTLRVEYDDVLGFGPDQAIRQITRHGPATAQTFLALAALWRERMGDAPAETYLDVWASDLLRFQGRTETPKGGYHKDDLVARGRDVYFLSRITLPKAQALGELQGLALSRLISLEALESVSDNGSESVVRFRYHLGREVHAWLGDPERSATVSSALLRYHPVRQKYQILLGFCLTCAMNNPNGGTSIELPRLLAMAGIHAPPRRLSAFLTTLEDAIADLARDGVLPGLRLVKPSGWTDLLAARQTRQILDTARIEYGPGS